MNEEQTEQTHVGNYPIVMIGTTSTSYIRVPNDEVPELLEKMLSEHFPDYVYLGRRQDLIKEIGDAVQPEELTTLVIPSDGRILVMEASKTESWVRYRFPDRHRRPTTVPSMGAWCYIFAKSDSALAMKCRRCKKEALTEEFEFV